MGYDIAVAPSYKEEYRPTPKGRVQCLYENEYCNDVSEGDGPQYYEMDFPSLESEFETVICEGKNENYTCNTIKGTAYLDSYEY